MTAAASLSSTQTAVLQVEKLLGKIGDGPVTSRSVDAAVRTFRGSGGATEELVHQLISILTMGRTLRGVSADGAGVTKGAIMGAALFLGGLADKAEAFGADGYTEINVMKKLDQLVGHSETPVERAAEVEERLVSLLMTAATSSGDRGVVSNAEVSRLDATDLEKAVLQGVLDQTPRSVEACIEKLEGLVSAYVLLDRASGNFNRALGEALKTVDGMKLGISTTPEFNQDLFARESDYIP